MVQMPHSSTTQRALVTLGPLKLQRGNALVVARAKTEKPPRAQLDATPGLKKGKTVCHTPLLAWSRCAKACARTSRIRYL